MSLVSKLNYLKQTKEAIKNALIGKGAIVATTDTFRSYAQKIEELESGTDLETIEIPIFKLKGDNPQTITKDSQYKELGVEILNHADTTELSIDTSSLNVSTVGIYTIEYIVTDTQNNASSILRRTVEVIELPEVYYSYDEVKAYRLTDNQYIHSASITYSGENIQSIILIKDGQQIPYEVGQKLGEGTYNVKLKKTDGSITAPLTFTIDDTPPIIVSDTGGTLPSLIRKTTTIVFKDIADLELVTLQTPDGDIIDIYALYEKGQLEQDENGNYIYVLEHKEEEINKNYKISAQDRAGNTYNKTLKVMAQV